MSRSLSPLDQTPFVKPTVEATATRNRLRDFPWWLIIIIAILLLMVAAIVTQPTYARAYTVISRGLQQTIYVTLVSFGIASVIGLVAGLGRVSTNVIVRNLAAAYVEFVRGVPVLVLIFTIAFVILPPFFASTGLTLDFRERAIISLALIYGAYIAEVFRAGIESIARGQMEAARSLGLNYGQAMRYVILPQAIRNVFPALGNDFIAMLKDSSLVSVLGVREITQLARLDANSTFRFRENFLVVTFLYLVATLVLSLILQAIQRRINPDG